MLKLPDGKDWLWGNLGLALMGGAMFNKSLIQFSADRKGFPGGSVVKESACNAGVPGSIPGLGYSPGKGNSNPLQCPCAWRLHGQRNGVGYSPWGHKKSDTTEQLSLSLSVDGRSYVPSL